MKTETVTSHNGQRERLENGNLPPPDVAQPGVPPGAAGPNPTAAAPGRRIDPLGSLRAHKLLASIVAVVITMLGAPVAWVMGKAGYYTEAVVRVSPRFIRNLNEDQELAFQSNSQYREFVQQQVYTINRFDIVSDALKKLGEGRRIYQGPAESDRRAAERLAKELVIRPVPDSYLIAIGLEGARPEGLAEVINSVVGTYLERAKTEEFFASDERIGNIQEERKKLLQDLEEKSVRRTVLSQEIGVTSFSESLLNPYDQMLIKSKEALEAARRKRIEAKAQLSSLEGEQQPGGKTAADAMAQELAIKDIGLNSLKANLYVRRSELLSKLSGLAEAHPGRRSVERELAEIDAEITRASDSVAKSFRSMFLDQRRADVFQAQQIEKELAAEADALGSRAMWFATRYQAALALGNEIERSRKRIAAIDDRVDFLNLEANAPGFVRMVSAARQPELPTKGGKRRLFGMVLLAALALGVIAPMAVDFVDPRIHNSDELEKILGFPPIGWILERTDEGSRRFAQDQLIRLATRLDREHRRQGTRLLVFTSDKAAQGTTSLVLDLAHALTGLGVRALAVEANAFKPDARYRGEHLSDGLVGLLDGVTGVEDVVTPGNEELPDRVCIGQAKGRRPLATLDQLQGVFARLAEVYDLILVDAPPLSLSADTEMLIGLSDATLLVVEAESAQKNEIKRTARILERLAPPVVGAILNRVRVLAAGRAVTALLRERQAAPGRRGGKLFSPWLWK